ncbi:hypothetical protein G6F42_023395 [Rhizopus arrhizus]|nr:hypothetical protein G6F42_023395 [Rhizopus arrhizus]
MTTDVFRKYIKRLNSSFAYARRNVAILVDNASVHKLKEEFSNIKLVFLPANTTSRFQPLDAGNIANFKAKFRWHQYFRAANKHISGVSLDHAEGYRMDEIDILYFLADSWISVNPQTVQNCWDHTKILDFKFNDREKTIQNDSAIPTFELPLDDDLINRLNEIIPDLPGNQGSDGTSLVTRVEELDLYADESNLIVSQSDSVEFDHDDDCDNEEEREDLKAENVVKEVDVKEVRQKLKHAYETILYHTLATDDQDRMMLKIARKKLDEIKSQEVAEKKQADVRAYFQPL